MINTEQVKTDVLESLKHGKIEQQLPGYQLLLMIAIVERLDQLNEILGDPWKLPTLIKEKG